MKKYILLLLAFMPSISLKAQWAVFDGANATNMGIEIGHSVTQIQKASDMLKRFQQVSSAVSKCNTVRNSLTSTIKDLEECRSYANSVALDKRSAQSLTSFYKGVNSQIKQSTSLMTQLMTSGKFSLDDQARLEKLAQLAARMRSISLQMKHVTYEVCQRSHSLDNYKKLKKQ